MTKARSKVIGETVEERVLERVDELQPAAVPEEWDGAGEDFWYDSTPERAIFAGERLPMVGICAIEPATPVEIKGARATISNGSGSRDGRFHIRRDQHERLVARDGVYIFALYRAADNELLGLLATLAVIVEEELRESWYNAGDGREEYYQIASRQLPFRDDGGDAGGE